MEAAEQAPAVMLLGEEYTSAFDDKKSLLPWTVSPSLRQTVAVSSLCARKRLHLGRLITGEPQSPPS